MKIIIVFICFLPLFGIAQSNKTKLDQVYDLLDKKEYDQSLRLADQLIKQDTAEAKYYVARGKAYRGKKNYDKAIMDFNHAIAISPDTAVFYLDRGEFYYSYQMPDSAIADFAKGLKFAVSDSEKYLFILNRGSAKIMKRDFEGAYGDFMQILKTDSTNLAALNNLGMILDDLGRADEAIPILEKVIRLYPDFEGGYGNLAFRYSDKGNYKKALELDNKVLQLDPEQPLGYNNRGFVKYKLHDLEGALKDINKSLELYPQNSYAYKNRALVYLEKNQVKKACVDLNKAIDYGFTEMYGTEVYLLIEKYCR